MKKSARLIMFIVALVVGCVIVNAQTNKKPRILVEKGYGFPTGFGNTFTILTDQLKGSFDTFGRAELVYVDDVQSEKLKTRESKCSDELLEEARNEGFDYVITISYHAYKSRNQKNSYKDKSGRTITNVTYYTTATFVQYMYDTNTKKVFKEFSVDEQSSGPSPMNLEEYAVSKANKYFPIYFRRFLNRTFPVTCKVTDIMQGEKKKDKKVAIDAGENRFVSAGDEFDVFFDKEKKGEITRKKAGSLKVISVTSDAAVCEIDGGGSKIEKFLKDGTLLTVTDDPNYKKSKGESDDEEKE